MALKKSERLARQRSIIALLARGYSKSEISGMLGLNVRTVAREIKLIEESTDRRLMHYTLAAFHRNMAFRDEELRKCTWKVYHEKDASAKEKMDALKLLTKLDQQALKFFETVGLLSKREEDDDVDFEGLSLDELRKLGKEILDEVDTGRNMPEPGDVHD